jgi:Ca2+-binding RTX toxin-like protein
VVVIVAISLLLVLPVAAQAATARVEGGVLVYEGEPGEVNDVVVAYFSAETLGGAAEYRIAEVRQMVHPQPAVTPLAGCRTHTNDPPHIVACPAAGITALRVNLNDGSDRARTIGRYEGIPGTEGCEDVLLNAGDDIPVRVTFDGGKGHDGLFEGPYMIVLPGFRCLLPRTPSARVSSYGGPGADLIVNATFGSGGPGADSLEAPDGRGARQLGGAGDDVVLGRSGSDRLDGGPGDDIIDGGAGRDSLLGSAGGDIMEGGLGDDRLLGGAGADEMNGKEGRDDLTGGSGGDVLEGEAGDDRLAARGGGRDGVSGGTGRDRATVDRHDQVRGVERR